MTTIYGSKRSVLRRQSRDTNRNEGPTLETLDYTIRIGSTPTFLYFDLYLYSAYAAHYVYNIYSCFSLTKGQRSKR